MMKPFTSGSDHVRGDLGELVEAVRPGGSGVDLVSLFGQVQVEGFADRAVVVNDENLGHAFHPLLIPCRSVEIAVSL